MSPLLSAIRLFSTLNRDPSVRRRDRIAFSKIGIKKFLKDSLERDAAIYSPWMVLSALVKRYGLPDQLPEHTRKAIEADRGIATEKRKRIWADKVPEEEAVVAEEGPASKKQKVNADGEGEYMALAWRIGEV